MLPDEPVIREEAELLRFIYERTLAQLIEVEQLTHTPIPIAGRVRENLIVTDASIGEQHRFGMPGPPLSQAERECWMRQLPASIRYAVLSGSLPCGMSAESYADLFRAVPRGG